MTDRTTAFRILTICAGNSALSQMAEAILETRGQKRPKGVVMAESAGIKPIGKVNEYAIVALMHHGIGWSRRETKGFGAFAGQSFDLVITLDDAAKAGCPTYLRTNAVVHWTLPDPTEHIAAATARAAFAASYTALVSRINALLKLPLETMTPEELQAEAQAIHDQLLTPTRRTSARLRRNS